MSYTCFFTLPLLVWVSPPSGDQSDTHEGNGAVFLGAICREVKLPFAPAPGHVFLVESGNDEDAFDLLVSPVDIVWRTSESMFEVGCAEMIFASQKEASGFMQKALANGWEMDDENDDG